MRELPQSLHWSALGGSDRGTVPPFSASAAERRGARLSKFLELGPIFGDFVISAHSQLAPSGVTRTLSTDIFVISAHSQIAPSGVSMGLLMEISRSQPPPPKGVQREFKRSSKGVAKGVQKEFKMGALVHLRL